MQTLSPSEVLTYTTVRLECRSGNGRTSVGTGFYFSFLQQGQSSIPAIVTNKHVVSGSATGTFFLHSADNTATPKRGFKIPVTIDDFQHRWIPHPNTEVDLCIMPLAPLLTEAKNKGIEPFFVPLDESLIPSDTELAELTALEDIIMIGYPIGIWDSHNNMPVIRRGITATHPVIDYEDRKEFMIDSACFPGSSGSPVFFVQYRNLCVTGWRYRHRQPDKATRNSVWRTTVYG